MCTKILLEQLEKLSWNGENALISHDWFLKFLADPWTKGLAVTLVLRNQKTGFRRERKIVLRRGQEFKLLKNMLQLWVERLDAKTRWLDKKVSKDCRIGPNVQRFVQTIMSRYQDADDIHKDRAMDSLRSAVRRAQESGLTEEDLKICWDEGLFSSMMAS